MYAPNMTYTYIYYVKYKNCQNKNIWAFKDALSLLSVTGKTTVQRTSGDNKDLNSVSQYLSN